MKEHTSSSLERKLIYRVVLIASIALIIQISVDTFAPTLLSEKFIRIFQLIICSVFLYMLIYEWIHSDRRGYYFITHLPLFIVSIPFLSIVNWLKIDIHHELHLFFYTIPAIRGIAALFLIIKWMIPQKSLSLLIAYSATLILVTYYGSLIFYQAELNINPQIHSYWDAMFGWALMNTTTVGAPIFAVTKTGQLLAVILSGGGMLFFPIFTSYIVTRYQNSHKLK
ncbi:MAG: two pore domain potassium channel family protein [Bacteroidales bacterium]|nr:two pore domain potassium channel family protein [Bacteroidales bacterium]